MNAATTLPEENNAAWERLAPHLEQAVAELSEADRAAVLLRYYEKKPLHEIGERLGISEDAAKKRVRRAVDKLRALLAQRGVILSGAGLAAILTEKTVEAAPAALAAEVPGRQWAGLPPQWRCRNWRGRRLMPGVGPGSSWRRESGRLRSR